MQVEILKQFFGKKIFFGGYASTRSFADGYVRARVWRACSLPRPQFISEEITMSSGDSKSITNGHNTTWVIVRVHIEQGWVFEAQGSVFYETSSFPFGGVVFAFSDSQIRLWVPKRGTGSSSANGVPFNAINGWGESGDFGYSKTVRVRAFAWDFKSFEQNPIVLEQTSHIPEGFISHPHEYHFHDNILLLFSVKAERGNNQGYQFYPAGSSMTDGTTDRDNKKFGSFVYGFTDDTIYFWTPVGYASGCVLLLDGLWGSQNQQHCLSENDVTLMITFNVFTIIEPACGVFPCAGASDRGPECICTGSGAKQQFCDNVEEEKMH
ncbi:Hypothetical predicted protein [Mytilus galloprovincialis]|uniref:Uncharacterized protein n=1 Tax=Mytilus galloprovincialis TaxID=29158 RepID=A0A8B6H6E2_MYTGA|nr:Hypothetical predicted protein [Mytilus galloprovincialis]